MLQLANDNLSLAASEDGVLIILTDLRRHMEWRLESPLAGDPNDPTNPPIATGPGQATRHHDQLLIHYPTAQGPIAYQWALHPAHVEVTLQTDPQTGLQFPAGLPLPGTFLPAAGAREIAIPLYQGLLIRPSGRQWKQTVLHGGHTGFSLSMAVLFGQTGALLVTHDSPVNWKAHFGETAAGPFFHFLEHRCPVEGWRGATVRFYPVDRNLTVACKTYRRLLQSRGQFVTWAQKIEDRPKVKNLFGALMAFVGYNKTSEIDYAQGARRLRDYGFETVLYYPLRMCHYSLDFKMGGDDPIWLSDEELAAVRAVDGALAGPWGWMFEGLDDGTPQRRAIFRHNQKGPIAGWKIDAIQWYQVCTSYQIEHIKARFNTDMKNMDWIHFDVNSSVPATPCLAPHALHHHRPLSAREDALALRQLFSKQTVGNRIIASEGFADHNTPFYDIGSTKLMPPIKYNPHAIPVPMTMLVFHDSCAHAWWEVHNYNALPGYSAPGEKTIPNSFPIYDLPNGLASAGSGAPGLKAAMDALYGSAPHVFPFGRQYAWKNFATKESYSFLIRLEDAAVQEALAAALPIARLHKKIGQLELLEHNLLSEDGSVQTTLFADGTRILANLSPTPHKAGPWGTLPGHSWKEVPS